MNSCAFQKKPFWNPRQGEDRSAGYDRPAVGERDGPDRGRWRYSRRVGNALPHHRRTQGGQCAVRCSASTRTILTSASGSKGTGKQVEMVGVGAHLQSHFILKWELPLRSG